VNGYGPVLERITRVPGVRGAMLVSVRDGLMVSDHLVESLKGAAVAALAASLAQRVSRVLSAAGAGQPAFWHLHASDGAILAVAAPGIAGRGDHCARREPGLVRLDCCARRRRWHDGARGRAVAAPRRSCARCRRAWCW
jgi:predicted regulator of Ras-like GTPase activity (Roadblock/LC7/MglB family)